jgi:hypothetical protein
MERYPVPPYTGDPAAASILESASFPQCLTSGPTTASIPESTSSPQYLTASEVDRRIFVWFMAFILLMLPMAYLLNKAIAWAKLRSITTPSSLMKVTTSKFTDRTLNRKIFRQAIGLSFPFAAIAFVRALTAMPGFGTFHGGIFDLFLLSLIALLLSILAGTSMSLQAFFLVLLPGSHLLPPGSHLKRGWYMQDRPHSCEDCAGMVHRIASLYALILPGIWMALSITPTSLCAWAVFAAVLEPMVVWVDMDLAYNHVLKHGSLWNGILSIFAAISNDAKTLYGRLCY